MSVIKKVLFLLVLLIIAAIAGFWAWANSPISSSKEAIPFDIKSGSLTFVIGQLNQQNVQINSTLFTVLARVSGKATKIKAGSYELKPNETPLALLNKLEKGLFSYETITIVEGWTFKQMREAIANHPKLKHDSVTLTDQELLTKLNIESHHAEGLFFPNTYFFSRGSSDFQIYRNAYDELKKRLDTYWSQKDPELPYQNAYEALIMASIVEKETGHPEDRAKIAGVFVNRLKVGMKLQTDPTVIYGLGENYRGTIYRSDLSRDTPYNTYTRFGLPPTPIALVGNAALTAAFKPEKTEALYFVSRADGTGKSEFTTNLSDHNKAVDKFLRSK